jgi:preprotein translocase SecE subunit
VTEDKATPKRRLVKKAETVREKTEKAAEKSAAQPRRLQATKRRAGAPFRAAGKGASRLGKYKPFRIFGFILVPPYFRNSWKELRQVTWTKPKESLRLTFAVVSFATVFGVLVAILDYGLDKVFKEVLLK